MTTAAELASYASSFPSFRNRIINGDMRIDQRGDISVTPSGGATSLACDRFKLQDYWSSGQVNTSKSTVAPTGFTNSLLLTVTTSVPMSGSTGYFASLYQSIEGFNIANAYTSTITLSFWVRSSINDTYSVTFANDSLPNVGSNNRIYVVNYEIDEPNTWEHKTITVDLAAGVAAGTWNTENLAGLCVSWNLGAESNRKGNDALGSWLTLSNSYPFQSASQTNWISTSGATFYITGVQLEVGTVATPFEHRPISVELSLAQRYLPAFIGNNNMICNGSGYDSNNTRFRVVFPVQTRVPATGLVVSSAAHFSVQSGSGSLTACGGLSIGSSGVNGASISANHTGGGATNAAMALFSNNASSVLYFTGCEL